MLDNSACNKAYALRYDQLGTAMSNVKGELPYIADDFKDIGKEADYAGDEVEDAGKKTKKSGNDMSKGFSKGLKSAKRLALGIVGIRSAYMLARKAASSYMTQDEDLAKSMQSVWTGLGAFLAPLLETLTNLMLKFVGYLNVFIKALTNKDLIATANAKILEKQAKAQEKLNKATKEYQNYDFDVIRTQQTDKSASSGAGTDEAQLINIPELNQNIVKKLQDLAEWLKKNKDLIKDVGIALGITFGAIAIGKLLANIGALLGSGALMTGLLGLAAILSILAIGYTIKVWIDGKKEIDEMWQKVHDLNEWNEHKHQEVAEQVLSQSPGSMDEKDVQSVMSLQGFYMEDYVRQVDEAYDHWQDVKNRIGGWSGVFGFDKGAERQYYDQINMMKQQVNTLVDLAAKGELTRHGYENLVTFANRYGDKIGWLNTITNNYNIDQGRLNEALTEYGDIYGQTTTAINSSISILKRQTTAFQDTNEQFMTGKINISEYLKYINSIPKAINTDVKANTKDAKTNVKTYNTDYLGKIPDTKSTIFKVDDKDAETKTKNYSNNLLKLPTSVLTTIKATLDTTAADWQLQQFKQKISQAPIVGGIFNKLFSVMGFAGGGYVSQPTFAMVGEGKYNEYVIPEGEDYISRLANEIGKYSSGGNGTVNVYLDGRLIQRQVDDTRNRVNFTKNR